MWDFIEAFPVHPGVLFMIALGALSASARAVWLNWISPASREVRQALSAAQGILALLEWMKHFMETTLPEMLERLDVGTRRFDHHESRIARIEERLGIDDVPPIAPPPSPAADWPHTRPHTPRVDE